MSLITVVKIAFCVITFAIMVAFIAICKNMEVPNDSKKHFNLLGNLGIIVLGVSLFIGFIDILFL